MLITLSRISLLLHATSPRLNISHPRMPPNSPFYTDILCWPSRSRVYHVSSREEPTVSRMPVTYELRSTETS